jgi:hypothetical protein
MNMPTTNRAAYTRREFSLGDKWRCECGKEHELSGAYLAAHWTIPLIHTCDKCKRVHEVMAGRITLIQK